MTVPIFTKDELERIESSPDFTLPMRHLAAFALAQLEGKEAAEAERETLRAVAITAERLCRYDGSKAMTAKGHFYDAAKAYEFSERLHELLAEWRKGQKEGRW